MLGRREVHGVERTNGLDRKRTTDTSEHGLRHRHQIASSCKDLERPHRRALVGRREAHCRLRPNDRARRLCEREGRRHAPTWPANGRPRSFIALQQRRDERARLDVTKRKRRVARSACCSRTPPPWASGLRLTLRHGRYRSTPPPCPAEAGSRASLRVDRHPRAPAEQRLSRPTRRTDGAPPSIQGLGVPTRPRCVRAPSPRCALPLRSDGGSGSGCPSALEPQFPSFKYSHMWPHVDSSEERPGLVTRACRGDSLDLAKRDDAAG